MDKERYGNRGWIERMLKKLKAKIGREKIKIKYYKRRDAEKKWQFEKTDWKRKAIEKKIRMH